MKKILLSVTLVGLVGFAQATTITPSGLGVLDGNNAYSWGISIAVPTGQTVTSAEIDFTSVTLTASGNPAGTGTLFTDLLNSKSPGISSPLDNDAAGDYWATKFSGANITSLGTKAFAAVGTSLTWSYLLNASQLTALNSYLAAGTFNIGIDPDCHFTVGGIAFNYTLGSPSPNNVPDGAVTAFLAVISLAGLEVFRRRFAVVRCAA